jgi:Cof subfamily protein (haloacid dehalogenase superfamily)
MNQSRYQLIALDIDGTLLNSEKEITPDTEAMVHRAFRAGKQVVLSTGRSFAELEEILQHFPEMRYGICESGALVFDRELEQPIAVHPIPLDIVCQAAEIARQRDVLIHIFQKGRPVISRHQMEQLDAYQIPYFRSMFQRYSLQVTDALDYCLALPAPSIEKINLYHHSTQERTVTQSLLSHLPLELVDSEKTSLELSATQVDKGRGLRELCAHLNIPVETTIAVGDSFNDAAILRAAGLAVGMGNAAEPVRRLCDVIVRDCDHDGVAEAIRTHLLTE